MDVTPYLDLKIAPRAVFDRLGERRTRARFMVPTEEGDWRGVTWGEHATQIRRVACWLRSVGVQVGQRVAIVAPNSVSWMSVALGIQAAGGVMVPIYPASTADQVAYIVQHADARVVFDETMQARQGDVTTSWASLQSRGAEWDETHPGAFEAMLQEVELDQPGLMLYTSGTTGRPKGVPLTHRNVAVSGRDWLQSNAALLEEDAVDVLWLPMSHIFGFGEACAGNMLGFTSFLSDPKRALSDLRAVKPSVFMSVPAYWEKIASAVADADDPQAALREATGGQLRFCLSGGAGLKREVKELFYRSGMLIIEGYGLTECSPTLTLNRPDDFRFDTVGKPLASVQLKLAGDGEILARGPNVFAGYHEDPEATRAAFTSDGWFKTGDIGRLTDDGFLQIVGRKKEILVTAGGKNVPPANIESCFADDPLFQHVVVYGDGKKYLTAGVWLSADVNGEPRSTHQLVAQRVARVNEELARFEQIKKFQIIDTPLTVESGMLTSTLKVRRKKVYEAFGAQLEALYES
jgi:long-chain acyl-CoA synthetase